MTTHRPLTIADVVALGTILEAAQQVAHVRYLNDSGDLCDGTARCIAHDGGGFLRANEDVRDGYLHISGIGELWYPVADLIGKVQRGEFVIDRPSSKPETGRP